MGDFLKFPEGFLWGSATSAHQVEGGNRNDWSAWERSPERIAQLNQEGKNPTDFISGAACDSYHRYSEDFDIAKRLGHTIHRLSIEWSRIEPQEGKFDHEEMRHYINVVKSLRERGIEPMVTLWHFSNPLWFSRQGGFLDNRSPERYKRFISYVVDNLKGDVGLWITFNEATTVYAGFSYMRGIWPPQRKSFFEFLRFRRNIAKAHMLAYHEIKNHYRSWPDVSPGSPQANIVSHNVFPLVGAVENNSYYVIPKLWERLGIRNILDTGINNWLWAKTLPYQDFLGLNYYTTKRIGVGPAPAERTNEEFEHWEIFPEGLYRRLMDLKKFNKPIFITENGIADASDSKRVSYIKGHAAAVWRAMRDGVRVSGYLYWSLLDNFEWHHGFAPRFGLVEIDYATRERKIRSSALEYAKIIRERGFIYPE